MTQTEFTFAPLFSGIAPHIVERFVAYHKENPHVYDAFKRFAFDLKRAGRDHFGAKGIMERLRWWSAVEAKGDEFKINNNFSSCYVRLICMEYPEFRGFFEVRTRRAA